MSPRSAVAFLSIPPVRGFVSVLFLLLLGAVSFQDGDLGVAARFGLGIVLLLLGAMIWTGTLAGFLRQVREPRRLGEAVIVANRPRRIAIIVSWIALAALVVALLSFGLLVARDVPSWTIAVCFLAVVDRDLGNRLNHRLSGAMERPPVQIPSAGPLFREIGAHVLPYPPTADLVETVEQAERIAGVDVLRVPAAS